MMEHLYLMKNLQFSSSVSRRRKEEVRGEECGKNKFSVKILFLVAKVICKGRKYFYSAF